MLVEQVQQRKGTHSESNGQVNKTELFVDTVDQIEFKACCGLWYLIWGTAESDLEHYRMTTDALQQIFRGRMGLLVFVEQTMVECPSRRTVCF